MGRHQLARSRRKSPALTAGAVAAFAVFFAVGGSAGPIAVKEAPKPVVEAAAETSVPCCVEIVQAAPAGFSSGPAAVPSATPAQMAVASRWRVIPRTLPVGLASERGLQVKTILVDRSISAMFPEIQDIGGVRADSLRWHPNGLALDVMIPNPGSDAGIQLGNEIVAYAMKNADRFDLQDAIWRGVYYTPSGGRSSIAGHFDHVHLTTHGGGYPTGSELYYR
ncbi:MAG: hypothetical protein ACRDUX_01930 [Mycobacterium sp.]